MEKREPNYMGLLVLGMTLIAIGASLIPKTSGPVLIAVGGLFFIISMKNKDKWKK